MQPVALTWAGIPRAQRWVSCRLQLRAVSRRAKGASGGKPPEKPNLNEGTETSKQDRNDAHEPLGTDLTLSM